jgi:signal transduction histidine kinase
VTGVQSRARDQILGVRMRTTVAATAVVALALLVGAYLFVQSQRSLLTDEVDKVVETRAADLARALSEGREAQALDVARREEALVQVIDQDGEVVASSENVEGLPPVSDPGSIGIDTVDDLPIDPDQPFRLLTNKVLTDDGLVTIVIAGSLEPIGENVEILVRNLWRTLPLLLVLVAIVTWLIVGRALRPVDAIRSQVESITDENLDRRVPAPRAHDEVGRLARTMNDMLERLQGAFERQDRFVADASHELRSPLTAMRSQIEVDRRHPDTADPATTQAALLEQIDQLQGLIDDLLFLARGESAPREAVAVDLDDLVLTEVQRLRPASPATIDSSAVSGGQVTGQPGELRRLVRNLLDNATRHAAGAVVVSLVENDGSVVLTVVDDGPGIPAEHRSAVFERFSRLDAARSHEGGSGLGLAIARDIAVRHGGSVAVDDAPDGGARFEVRLPRAPH